MQKIIWKFTNTKGVVLMSAVVTYLTLSEGHLVQKMELKNTKTVTEVKINIEANKVTMLVWCGWCACT